VKTIWRWAAVAALAFVGPAVFGQEPLIPTPAVPAAAPPTAMPQGTSELFSPGCAACSGCGSHHAEGDTCQRIVNWVLFRPTLTPCCWGGGCGCGCKQCDCLYPHVWEFFLCSGHGVVRAQCHDEPDCGGGCGCGGGGVLSIFHSHP
jgi:hypothetical protein